MSPYPAAALALLADIAREHAAGTLVPDSDGLVPMKIDNEAVVLVFSPAWESLFLSAVLAKNARPLDAHPFAAFTLGPRFAGPRTRIAIEPRSGALIVIAEFALEGMYYPAFETALKTFLADLRLARAQLHLPAIL